jgi:hypothetical protein
VFLNYAFALTNGYQIEPSKKEIKVDKKRLSNIFFKEIHLSLIHKRLRTKLLQYRASPEVFVA